MSGHGSRGGRSPEDGCSTRSSRVVCGSSRNPSRIPSIPPTGRKARHHLHQQAGRAPWDGLATDASDDGCHGVRWLLRCRGAAGCGTASVCGVPAPQRERHGTPATGRDGRRRSTARVAARRLRSARRIPGGAHSGEQGPCGPPGLRRLWSYSGAFPSLVLPSLSVPRVQEISTASRRVTRSTICHGRSVNRRSASRTGVGCRFAWMRSSRKNTAKQQVATQNVPESQSFYIHAKRHLTGVRSIWFRRPPRRGGRRASVPRWHLRVPTGCTRGARVARSPLARRASSPRAGRPEMSYRCRRRTAGASG